jgi:hypothetical protein
MAVAKIKFMDYLTHSGIAPLYITVALYEMCYLPILTHVAEIGMRARRDERKLQIAELKFIRSIEKQLKRDNFCKT